MPKGPDTYETSVAHLRCAPLFRSEQPGECDAPAGVVEKPPALGYPQVSDAVARASARVQGALSMRNRVVPRWLVALVSTAVVVVLAVTSTAGQSTTAGSYRAPRTLDGKPDISGIWQVLNTASWDIQAHNAADG